METRDVRVLAIAIAILFASVGQAAAGAVNISSCQFLTTPGTTYKLTTDLTSCGDCLAVLADRVTVDLQGHSITSTCEDFGRAVTDLGVTRDVIVIKDGAISGYPEGINLGASMRVTVVGLEVTGARFLGIGTGFKSLVKSSVVTAPPGSLGGGIVVLDRGQVEESDASNNFIGISCLSRCLITRNTANNNFLGIFAGSESTVSFNTANDNNGSVGIAVTEGSLVTRNTATGNAGLADFSVQCPSTVTFNTSSGDSYHFFGFSSCHAAHND